MLAALAALVVLAALAATFLPGRLDVDGRSGGFACLPGSHRPDYSWPAAAAAGAGGEWRWPVGGKWQRELGVATVSAGRARGQCRPSHAARASLRVRAPAAS